MQIIMEEKEKKEPKPRGGAREGAGRKSKSKSGETKRVAFRCSHDVWQILELQQDKTAYIEAAVREKWKHEQWKRMFPDTNIKEG